jgi:hypothetical protein
VAIGKLLRVDNACANWGFAFSTKLQASVGSLVVPPDSGEMTAALELTKTLPLKVPSSPLTQRSLTNQLSTRSANAGLPSLLDKDWPGITAVCRIERIRELKDRCSREVIYAITSLPTDKLDPAYLLQLSRDHWQIENRLPPPRCDVQ